VVNLCAADDLDALQITNSRIDRLACPVVTRPEAVTDRGSSRPSAEPAASGSGRRILAGLSPSGRTVCLGRVEDREGPRRDPGRRGPLRPRLLAQAPDHVRAALYAALDLHCTYRADQNQVTIRAAITDTTPGIVAALTAAPNRRRNPKAAPENFDDPASAATVPETPWASKGPCWCYGRGGRGGRRLAGPVDGSGSGGLGFSSSRARARSTATSS
jgi:hypothetical protein